MNEHTDTHAGRALALSRKVMTASPERGLEGWQRSKLIAHIERELGQPLANAALATLVELTTCHFIRRFHASFGITPHAYVVRRRMARAQLLLLGTAAPLSQIALDCGLSDQAHLSRLFRRFVGATPSDWRRARRDAVASQRSI